MQTPKYLKGASKSLHDKTPRRGRSVQNLHPAQMTVPEERNAPKLFSTVVSKVGKASEGLRKGTERSGAISWDGRVRKDGGRDRSSHSGKGQGSGGQALEKVDRTNPGE